MSVRNDYQLLDFGDGRRLERFGEIVLDRPCPAAEAFQRADPDLWKQADARFEGREQQRGQWTDRRELPERWTVSLGSLQFELKRTEFGHLGLFPEQAENWGWIAEQCRSAGVPPAGSIENSSLASGNAGGTPVLRLLNLFAYTGGSTLAAAAAGAEVVHVDAAKNIVAWARRNAELSGLTEAPVRWIVEDALKFVKRELKRGNRYDTVILDPPSYGHGPHGEVWRLTEHLPRLLDLCAELTAGRPRFMLLTCHTPGYDSESLRSMVQERFCGEPRRQIDATSLTLRIADDRTLPSGTMVRYSSERGNSSFSPGTCAGIAVARVPPAPPGTSAGAKRGIEASNSAGAQRRAEQ
jgi:23S rRNA (cytosine1962-C5)-methyltransferase